MTRLLEKIHEELRVSLSFDPLTCIEAFKFTRFDLGLVTHILQGMQLRPLTLSSILVMDQVRYKTSSSDTIPQQRLQDTLRSLQIFSKEIHPSLIKGTGRSKEGFSLFAYLDQTRSIGGRRVLKEWMMRPSREISVSHMWHPSLYNFERCYVAANQ